MTKEKDSTAMVQVNNEKNVPINCFGTLAGFEAGQRIANMFSQSNLVPSNFKGDIGSCLIALNMANRMGADPLQVMQSLYIVHGKPSFSSAFLIACFNRCGRFSTIRYRMQGTKGKDNWGCVAYSTELATGELIEGVEVTIGMAKAEGWYNKTSSKWQTMPELMLRYRAATFLIRSVAPDIALGFPTTEEAIDITDQSTVISNTTLDEVAKAAVAEQAQAAEPVTVVEEVEPAPEAEQAAEPSALAKAFEQMKAKHPDTLLLFRMGDFYGSFADDANTLSEVLGITLTRTSAKDITAQQAAFPAHALDTYLPKIVRAGKRVAICDEPTKVVEKVEPAAKGQDFTTKYFKEHHIAEKHGK